MPHKPILTLLTLVVLQLTGLSFQSYAASRNCDVYLESGRAAQKLNWKFEVMSMLNVNSPQWLSWQGHERGLFLATLSAPSGLQIFEPLRDARVVYSSADFRPVVSSWVAEPSGGNASLYMGEGNGLIRRLEIGSWSTQVVAPADPGMTVFDSDENPGPIVLVGGGQASRVRIMPIGSHMEAVNLQAAGPVQDVLLQREPSGRHLAAVKSQNRLEVFDLGGGSAPIYTAVLLDGQSVEPRWATDRDGKSVLVYMDGFFLHVDFPGTPRKQIILPLTSSALLHVQTLLLPSGDLIVLLKDDNGNNRVLRVLEGDVREGGSFRSAPGQSVRLFVGRDGKGYAIFVAKDSTRLQVADLRSPQRRRPVSLQLESGEKVHQLVLHKLESGDQLVAAGTNRRIYILKLNTQSSP